MMQSSGGRSVGVRSPGGGRGAGMKGKGMKRTGGGGRTVGRRLGSPSSAGRSSLGSPRRSVGSGGFGGAGLDVKYVASLKEQINYLELECSVLKSKQKIGAGQRNTPGNGKGMQSSFSSALGVEDSMATLSDRLRGLELEHQLEIDKRDAERTRLREELSAARTHVHQVEHEMSLVQARADDMVESQARGMEKEFEKLQSHIFREAGLQEKVELLEGELKAMEDKFYEERKLCKLDEEKIRGENDRLSRDVVFYKNRVEELEGSCGVDRKRLQDLELGSTSYEKTIEQLKENLGTSLTNVEQLHAELAHCRSCLQKLEDSHEVVLEENKQLVENNALLTEKLRQVKLKVTQYASREDVAAKERNDALIELETQQVKTDTMKEKVEFVEKELKIEIESHQRDSAALAVGRSRIQELSLRLEKMTRMFEDAEAKRGKADDHAAKLLAQVSMLSSQREHLESSLEKARQACMEAEQAKVWAEEKQGELEEQLQINRDLEGLNIGQLRATMETNLQLAQQFDIFLQKHGRTESPTDPSRN